MQESGFAAWNSAVFSLVHTRFTTDVKRAMRQASVYNDASTVVLFASPLSCTETAVDDVSSLLSRSEPSEVLAARLRPC